MDLNFISILFPLTIQAALVCRTPIRLRGQWAESPPFLSGPTHFSIRNATVIRAFDNDDNCDLNRIRVRPDPSFEHSIVMHGFRANCFPNQIANNFAALGFSALVVARRFQRRPGRDCLDAWNANDAKIPIVQIHLSGESGLWETVDLTPDPNYIQEFMPTPGFLFVVFIAAFLSFYHLFVSVKYIGLLIQSWEAIRSIAFIVVLIELVYAIAKCKQRRKRIGFSSVLVLVTVIDPVGLLHIFPTPARDFLLSLIPGLSVTTTFILALKIHQAFVILGTDKEKCFLKFLYLVFGLGLLANLASLIYFVATGSLLVRGAIWAFNQFVAMIYFLYQRIRLFKVKAE
jgi:hypothetical protein